jgi:flagellar basal body-associated protein FliL
MLEMVSVMTIFIVAAMIIFVVATFGGIVYLLLHLVNKKKNEKQTKKDND